MSQCEICVAIYEPYGPYGALSNFADIPISVEGVDAPSVEHYFQSRKFSDPEIARIILRSRSPEFAKQLAWTQYHKHVRADWDSVRIGYMRDALTAKFTQNRIAREVLVDTASLRLFENSDDDLFWGVGAAGDGANALGSLLAEVRAPFCGGSVSNGLAFFNRTREEMCGGSRLLVVDVERRSKLAAKAVFQRNALVAGELFERTISGFIRASGRRNSDAGCWRSAAVLDGSLGNALKRGIFIGNYNRALAFDEKYHSYSWWQDARSAVRDWVFLFRGALCAAGVQFDCLRPAVVVGAGSANECLFLWNTLGANVTIADVGPRLLSNCHREAPFAQLVATEAEHLRGVDSESYDAYFALRVFQSDDLDVAKAIRSAGRVLRDGGHAIISMSNAYLAVDGRLVKGQVAGDGSLDLGVAWGQIADSARMLIGAGFHIVGCVDLATEVAIIARKERRR